MKKDFIYIVILLILLLPTQILMIRGYKSLDGLIHTARIAEFHEAIKVGQIPVRLAPSLMGQIGYPLFVVNYQLPYYLAEIFMTLNNSPMFAYKSVMAASFIASGVFAFLLFRKIGSNISALVGATVFSYTPYRFGDLYSRGAFGESVSIMFVPLVFLSFHKIEKNDNFGLPLLAISTFGLITTHTVIFAMFLPIIAIYILFILKPHKLQLLRLILGLTLGLSLSSFQLLPSVFEKSYLRFDENLGNEYAHQFVSIYQLLRIPKPGLDLGTYYQIGIASSTIAIIGFLFMVLKRSFYLLFLIGIFALSIFFTTDISKVIWDNFKPITYVLYPYRFIIVTIFAVSFISAYLVNNIKPALIVAILFIFLAVYPNRHFLIIAPWAEIPPANNLTTHNEADPIWSNKESFKDSKVVTANDTQSVSNLSSTPFSVSFSLDSKNNADVIIRKLYFPGWQLRVNNRKYPIFIKEGLIAFLPPIGISNVSLEFTESHLRYFSNLLTLLSLVLITILSLRIIKRKNL